MQGGDDTGDFLCAAGRPSAAFGRDEFAGLDTGHGLGKAALGDVVGLVGEGVEGAGDGAAGEDSGRDEGGDHQQAKGEVAGQGGSGIGTEGLGSGPRVGVDAALRVVHGAVGANHVACEPRGVGVDLRSVGGLRAAFSEQLTGQIDELNRRLTRLVERHAPQLLVPVGIGPDSAVTLLITMGNNPERLSTEASFVALCGVSPIEYSSGRRSSRRLNHGGDRQPNAALHRIVFTRLRFDPRTQAYYECRTQEGKTRREIIRCLKRYAAREVFNLVRTASSTPSL
ncbi:transposase [Streptomyces sp. NPDC054813]